MTGQGDLRGQRILVVEDDYFLAADTASAIRGAGAEVIGPCPTFDAVLARIEDEAPTGAVVDINLGGGPSFAVARALRERGVPLLFVTGYDDNIIPDEFGDIQRFEKPIELREVVGSLARLVGAEP